MGSNPTATAVSCTKGPADSMSRLDLRFVPTSRAIAPAVLNALRPPRIQGPTNPWARHHDGYTRRTGLRTSPVRAGPGQRLEAGGGMAQAMKIIGWILVIFILYTIIMSPTRSADLVQVGFQGISTAAHGIGKFFSSLVK